MLTFPLFWLIMIYFIQLNSCTDYWGGDTGKGHNCEKPDEIAKLKSLSPSQCKSVKSEDDKRAFRICKTQLAQVLQKKCDYTKVANPGELLYCKKGGELTCCFANESCEFWANIQSSIYTDAKEYLTNRRSVLNKLVQNMGYNTCHHLNSLDASKCATDCKDLEKGKFAKKCKSEGGLFKCCIRRDKRSCHECRYCCTLGMCTKPPGGKDFTVFDGLGELKLKSQKNKLMANDLFFSNEYIYKNDDYHCLKPDSDKDPEKWRKYDMQKYRHAYNQKTLDKVPTYKYDNMLYNFADPKVFKAFTRNEKKGNSIWARTYGYQYTSQIPGFQAGQDNNTLDATVCLKKCIEMENSKFARQCRKDGGYFKCCGSYWRLDSFEDARNNLIRDGLVKDKESNICNEKAKDKNPCLYCSMNGICTKSDPATGDTVQQYYLGTDAIPEGKLDAATIDLRMNWCLVLDLCKYHSKGREFYDKINYKEAQNKEEVCESVEKFNLLKKKKIKPEERCRILYTENFYLCTDDDKKNFTDQKMLSLSNELEKMIKNHNTAADNKRSRRKKKARRAYLPI